MSKFTPSTDIVRAKYRYPLETPTNDAEFDRWLDQVKADAWDEGYRDGHNDGLSDGHPLGNDREPEENPYRDQEEV